MCFPKFSILPLALALSLHLTGVAQEPGPGSLPHIVEKDGRHALIVDGAPYLMLGGQVGNSNAWPAMLPKVWASVESLHANTVEIPIYWEQFEPRPGKFDDSLLSTLLNQARLHHVHLVLLWFGTWKNGSGHYTPEWIKRNNTMYPHVVGRNGRNVDSLSPMGTATIALDRAAFVALMGRLKALDPQHTALMVQVENESGSWGSVRDFGAAAEKAFGEAVPATLLHAMNKQPGTWRQVFGDDADEYFHAWTIARDIEQVAAAGKAVYPLPMYVNAALRDPLNPGKANTYESGGPTDNVIPVWKAAAPSIDILAPDIYLPDYARYTRVLDLYARPDNAMFVPETGRGPDYGRYLFAALGHGTIGFSPFGIDSDRGTQAGAGEKPLDGLALSYAAIAPMDREIAKWNFEGKVQAVSQPADSHEQTLEFGEWKVTVGYGSRRPGGPAVPASLSAVPQGGALVAQLGPDEFVVLAVHARVDFHVADAASDKQRQFIRVEEGTYSDGNWHFIRVWNGDETDFGLGFNSVPVTLKVSLATY
jgi:beta-galactosidase GanA